MPTPEEILVQKIKDAEVAQELARATVAKLKLDVCKAESVFIECRFIKERLVEELRALRLKKVDLEPTHAEKDLERFKLALPDLLKKIK